MKEKTQYEALVEELQKIVENFKVGFTEIGEILSKILPDVEIPDEEEDTWEMKCPYKDGDKYLLINEDGSVSESRWDDWDIDKNRFSQGNIFPTEQAALLEAERRNLLTRFRAFRDECNGDWKPDWSSLNEKWDINYDVEGEELKAFRSFATNSFSTFGYFKNGEVAERAIELFGDEIKELFVEGEVSRW